MTKGPSPVTHRMPRPKLAADDIPWIESPQPLSSTDAACEGMRSLMVELIVPVVARLQVVAVPLGGDVRVISDGRVVAVLSEQDGSELVRCMAAGWRYSGELTPVRVGVGSVVLEGRRIL